MQLTHSVITAHRSGRNIKKIELKKSQVTDALLYDLEKHGVRFAMDSLQALQTTASMATPIQFAQTLIPGQVNVITEVRVIDEIVGITNTSGWQYEEVLLQIQELTGKTVPYGDMNNIPLASWNNNFQRRTIVRGEEGFYVGRLEEQRAALMNVNSGESKRRAVALSLDIFRNDIGFYGFNSGLNLTYGLLNDPQLPAYVTLPNGASGQPYWSKKTYLEITADIRTQHAALRTQSGGNIDPENTDLTMVLPTNAVDYLSVVSDFGNSVKKWLTDTYPRTRVISAPQFNQANGGIGVGYLFADKVNDPYSTDGGNTFLQVVPTQYQMLGVEQKAKGYLEDATNATAGVWLLRPWAVTRFTGVSA